MKRIEGNKGVLLQPMLDGIELFAGAIYEPAFGHVVLCGMGGIFVEVMKDVSSELAPLTMDVAHEMIGRLRGNKMLKGMRGQDPVDEALFAGILVKLSALATACPEIEEMDLNPLIGSKEGIWAVDARIKIGDR
jgi:acyl-CoA synthetase (NDP forming)